MQAGVAGFQPPTKLCHETSSLMPGKTRPFCPLNQSITGLVLAQDTRPLGGSERPALSPFWPGVLTSQGGGGPRKTQIGRDGGKSPEPHGMTGTSLAACWSPGAGFLGRLGMGWAGLWKAGQSGWAWACGKGIFGPSQFSRMPCCEWRKVVRQRSSGSRCLALLPIPDAVRPKVMYSPATRQLSSC